MYSLGKSSVRLFSTTFFKGIKQFSPVSIGLKPEFNLLNYATLKGCGCKVPQQALFEYLRDVGDGSIGKETPDCSVTKSKNSNEYLISTTDFFYPLVEDPFLQGKIAACNVLSDIYAMGIDRVDHLLMILGVSLNMVEEARAAVTREMIKGFNATAMEAGTLITGGQSVMNPWPMIGGIANVVCGADEFIIPRSGEVGDVIILTKPLGTQVAVNLKQWKGAGTDQYKKSLQYLVDEDIEIAYSIACESMGLLNKNAAKLMLQYKAHGATDITGFGILGHARNLAHAQTKKISIRIHSLPIINKMELISPNVLNFKLVDGFSAETSGGLFIMIPKDRADDFMKELREKYEQDSWLIGEVIEGEREAFVDKDPTIINVA